MSVNRRTAAYWVTTGLLAAGMVYGGLSDVTRLPDAVAVIVDLGYPLYFVTIVGVWKLLSAIVLVAPRLPLLKEWAYAGIFFDVTGAFVSHLVIGSAAQHFVYSGVFILLTIASWALRPRSRTLAIMPARMWPRLQNHNPRLATSG